MLITLSLNKIAIMYTKTVIYLVGYFSFNLLQSTYNINITKNLYTPINCSITFSDLDLEEFYHYHICFQDGSTSVVHHLHHPAPIEESITLGLYQLGQVSLSYVE